MSHSKLDEKLEDALRDMYMQGRRDVLKEMRALLVLRKNEPAILNAFRVCEEGTDTQRDLKTIAQAVDESNEVTNDPRREDD